MSKNKVLVTNIVICLALKALVIKGNIYIEIKKIPLCIRQAPNADSL